MTDIRRARQFPGKPQVHHYDHESYAAAGAQQESDPRAAHAVPETGKSKKCSQGISSGGTGQTGELYQTKHEFVDVWHLSVPVYGASAGELCSLRWCDIDLEGSYIHIRHTVQRLPLENLSSEKKTNLIISEPKSVFSIRMIPIPEFLYGSIQTLAENYTGLDYVLTGSQCPMEPRTMQYRYKKCLQEADIRYLNFHTLRHTFATRCIMAGMDPKTLSEILGHSDIKITLEYYFHSSLEFKKNR